ncbi:MAG: PAS domain-containing protein, partial [Steroidobacteraceae bacterium]
PNNPRERTALRSRAVTHLTATGAPPRVPTDPSAALGVLYELASSPSTAPSALALLHELQVHQVEVELQDEELRRSRVELETALNRQVHLYDCAPVAYFTVDRNTVLSELNLPGASLLGFDRDVLLGRSLDSFLTPGSVPTLHAMLERVTKDAVQVADLQLRGQDGATRRVYASARRDPAGESFLLAWIEATGGQPGSAT